MNQPLKIKKDTIQQSFDNHHKTRYSINYVYKSNRIDLSTIRSLTKKTKKPNQPNQLKNHFLKNNQNHPKDNKSPYLRRQKMYSRTSNLDRSQQKNKSTHLIKKSPYLINSFKDQKSICENKDDQSGFMRKRSSSVCGQYEIPLFDEIKELFKRSLFGKAIESLKRYIRVYNNHLQARYLLGMSYINRNDFNLGIKQISECLRLDPKYKESCYLVIALAYKKLHKLNQAIEILTKSLQYFPNCYQSYTYRGKLLFKLHKYQQSCSDFAHAIKINNKKGLGHLGKGNCLKEMGKVHQAIKTYSQGLQTDLKLNCYEKRGECYFILGHLNQSLQDYQKCSEIDYNYSPINYCKGIILYKIKKYTEAILYLQQCLKTDQDTNHLTIALQTLIKIKIQQKNFYEAYHILNRVLTMDLNQDIINDWRLFLQGTLFLIKKKSNEGLKLYQQLLKHNIFQSNCQLLSEPEQSRYLFLKPLIHLYKGYAQFAIGNKTNSKKQYHSYEKVCKQLNLPTNDLSKQYNLIIIQAQECFPKSSLPSLYQCNRIIPNKPQPYLYLAMNKVAHAISISPNKLIPSMVVQQVINHLSDGIYFLPQLSNNHISSFFYFRSIIYLYNNQFSKALEDIDKAIEKSEDNIAKYFYLRGLIFSNSGNFCQAIQDYSITINLDPKYARSYLERTKCHQLQGNSNDAFIDLQKYITLAPNDKNIHKYAAFLLFQNCAYEDCLLAFSHGSQQRVDLQIIATKAKCNFLLGNLKESLIQLEQYNRIDKSKQYSIDIIIIHICQLLQKQPNKNELQKLKQQIQSLLESNSVNGKIFKSRDIYQLRASLNLLLPDYEGALLDLNQTLTQFRIQKNAELQKQFVDDIGEFQQQWSEFQIKYNMSLCYLGLNNPKKAKQILLEFNNSSQKGKHWDQYIQLLDILSGNQNITYADNLEIFDQTHRLSKLWPQVNYQNIKIQLNIAYSYPYVDPPQLLPSFDQTLLEEFDMRNNENKPQAPWINRGEKGLVFTPNVENFDQLQISVTIKQNRLQSQDKNDSNSNKSDVIKNENIILEGQDLKRKFKLNSEVEMRLKKLLQK